MHSPIGVCPSRLLFENQTVQTAKQSQTNPTETAFLA
jgi:hypothetical protein